jgi:hypothetical protein
MKVWEKIKESAKKENIHFKDCKDIRAWMYMNRVTPCDMEEEWEYVFIYQMDELCDKHAGDCEKCLDEYLNTESEGI